MYMKRRCIIDFIKKFNRAFDLRENNHIADFQQTIESVKSLQFDGIEQGKKRMREDLVNLSHDFKHATLEAHTKLKNEECLSY